MGIVLNLSVATSSTNHGLVYDLAQVIANVDYSASMINDFEYLLEFNWVRNMISFFFLLLSTCSGDLVRRCRLVCLVELSQNLS